MSVAVGRQDRRRRTQSKATSFQLCDAVRSRLSKIKNNVAASGPFYSLVCIALAAAALQMWADVMAAAARAVCAEHDSRGRRGTCGGACAAHGAAQPGFLARNPGKERSGAAIVTTAIRFT